MTNVRGLVKGETDTYGYEKIEVIRGANGLLTGVGNASGTINSIRKRPNNHAMSEVSISAGSWDKRRVDADYSSPFSAYSDWAGRLVMAVQHAYSHLRDKEDGPAFLYALVDDQLTSNITLE